MKTNLFKRSLSSLLAVVMCLSTFLGIGTTTAFAAAEQHQHVPQKPQKIHQRRSQRRNVRHRRRL